MKKVLKVFILMIVLVFGIVFNAYAAGENVVLTTNSEKVKAGDNFTVSINVNCTTNFEGLTGILKYDRTKLELVNAQNGVGMNNMNDENSSGDYVITIFANSSTPVTQAVCQTLTFKVLSDVNEGENLSISIKNIQFAEEGKEALDNLSANTSVQVETMASGTDDDTSGEDTLKPDQLETPSDTSEDNNKPSDLNKDETQAKPDTKSEDNKQKDNIKPGSLPDTGSSPIVGISLITVVVLAIVFYLLNRKYKNI